MNNVLLSTSRQWNCGDEFILFGVQRLLGQALNGPVNWMIYDRNPDVLFKEKIGGNSWRGEDLHPFGHVVFAGSPEWYGKPLAALTKPLAVSRRIRPAYIGVGAFDYGCKFTPDDVACLRKACVIVCRDQNAAREVKRIGLKPVTLPCPAFFAAPEPATPKTGGKPVKIGVCFQTDQTVNQNVPGPLFKAVTDLIGQLRQKYEVEAVAHYRDEFFHASKIGVPVRYSYDARDYASIYSGYDAVVSTRLHGAIMAAGCGVPALMVNPSSRATGAASLFPSMTCKVEDVAARLEALNVGDESARLIEHRWKTGKDYRECLGVIGKNC